MLRTPKQENQKIYKVLQKLEKYGSVCVSTNKTNSTRVIEIKNYKRWISDHLLKVYNLALHPKVVSLSEEANKLLETVKMQLSVKFFFCEAITIEASDLVSKVTE